MRQDCLQSDDRYEGEHYPNRDGKNNAYQVGSCGLSHGTKIVLQKQQLVRRPASFSASVEASEWNW